MFLPTELDTWKEAAILLVKEGGKIVNEALCAEKSIETKSSFADLVTESDKAVEEHLVKGLREQFPDHKFIGEESTAAGTACELTDAPTWIIDPIDGTMNFVHGFPFVAISVGLAYRKEIILGLIYNPPYDRMYYAVKGQGAFMTHKKIERKLQVSGQKDISKALIAMETGSSRTPEVMNQVFANYTNIAPEVHGIRSLGSAAINMCCIADGVIDCYFEYTIHCWDIAAGKIIVEEAGGVVQDPEGGPLNLMGRRLICGSSQELVDSVCKHLQHIQMPSD